MLRIIKVLVGLGAVVGLGVAFLPLSSYAANPENVTVNITIAPALSAESVCGSAGNSTVGNSGSGGMTAGTTATVTCAAVYSANGPASISIKDKDTNTNLTGTGANTIAAMSTTANLADIGGAAGAAWGYKFAVNTAGAGSGGLTIANANRGLYNGVSATAVTVGSNTAVVTGATGTFTFGVKTVTSTTADTYTDVVVIAVTAGA